MFGYYMFLQTTLTIVKLCHDKQTYYDQYKVKMIITFCNVSRRIPLWSVMHCFVALANSLKPHCHIRKTPDIGTNMYTLFASDF